MLGFLLGACSSTPDLSSEIEIEFEKSGWKEIDLNKVTNFEWDRVCIVGPYSQQEHQDNIFGFHSELLSSGNDGESVLAFITNNKVVKHVTHPRNKGDFLGSVSKCPENGKAVFIRDPKEKGTSLKLVLKNA